MRKLGIGSIGRVGALFFSIATIVGCGDNGVVPPPDAPEIDAPPPRPAVLTMAPMTNDFGSVVINTNSGAASFTVTNTGEATSGSITPVITGAAAADFTPTNGCTTLAGGGTCVITVVFHPASAGVKNANLVVSGSPGGSAMATLIGTGQTPGTLTISPSSLAFGNQVNGTPTASQTFTVTNTGTVATTALTVTKAGTDPADFVKGADTCNTMTLAGGATCTIAVTFNPTTSGNKAASFVISASTGGSVNGAVTGTGLDPARLSVVPGFQDFGSITTGTSSGNISFTVTNEGDVATSAITDSFTAPNGAEFSRISTTCTTLAPGASCTIVVRFTPTTVGAKMSNLSVTAATGGTATASLIGAAVAPGNLSISPTPFAFADTTVGQVSTTQVFTVTNTGGSATGALGTALGGTDPSHFTVVAGSNGCQGVVLAPAGTCTIVLSFAPTTGGLKSATLAINHTGGSTTAAISGTGIAPAMFTLAPASRDYGSVVTTTTSPPQNFVLTNVGGQTSGVPAFAINGANASEFAVNATGCPAALAPNGSCTVQVTFSPATAGAKTASLDVTGTGGPVSSALSGNGISNAALSVNPSIINFPLTLIGNSATVETFTVTNNGSVDTGNLTITVIPAGEYTQTNNCTDGAGPGVDFLTPGASCVVTVTFSPTTPGLRSATIQVSGTPGGTVGTAVNGNALAKLEIETPTPVTFPINMYTFPNSIVDPDVSGTVQVTLRNNNTTAAIAVTEVQTFGGNFALVGAPCTAIAAGGTCVATYEYIPQTINTHMGNVIFTVTGGGAGNTAQQNFTGTSNLMTLAITDAIASPNQLPDSTATSHDFGNRSVGSSSGSRTFRVTNQGQMPTGILAVDLAGAGFQIESNGCSGISLTDMATCDIVVVFTPTAQATQMGTITVRTSQGAPFLGGTVTATVSGTGVAPGAIATPAAVTWGTVFAGDTSFANTRRVVVITNPNDVPTTLGGFITDDALSGTQFTQNNAAQVTAAGGVVANNCLSLAGNVLPAGASCNAVFELIPALPAGARSGSFTLTQSVGALQTTVTFSGTVQSTISISAVAPFVDQVVGTTASRTVTVTNNSPQTVTGFTITAGGAPYFILNNNCASLVGAGATCTFDLSYQPTSPGNNNAGLSVTATNGEATASVVANAITVASIQADQTAFNFGTEIVGQNGATHRFTFTNVGQQTSGTIAVTLPMGTTSYTILPGGTCTGTLAFNASCFVDVRFNPTATGALPVTLTGTASPGGSDTVALTGTGLAAGGIRVTPSAHVFAATTVGSLSGPTQTFTVQETSGVGGPYALLNTTTGEFAVVTGVGAGTCGATLAAGTSCTVIVRYAPVTAGDVTGTLNVTGATIAQLYGRGLTVANVVNNASPVPSFGQGVDIVIPDSGSATPYPSNITVTGITGTVSSLSLRLLNLTHTFPADIDIILQSPDGRRLVLMSDAGGSGDVSTINVTFSDSAATLIPSPMGTGTFRPTNNGAGDAFPVINGGQDPAPAGSATLASVFNGAVANGTWSLFVVDDAGGDQGVIDGWELFLNGTTFPDTAIGSMSGSQTIQFSNLGQTTAAPLVATQTGPDGTHFSIMNNCQNVALTPVGTPGSTCTVVATFAPTTTGTKTTQLNFTGGMTATLPYSGLGVNPAMLSISPSVLQDDGNRVISDADTTATTFTISNLLGSSTTSAITFTLSDTANFAFAPGGSCALNGTQTLAPNASCTVNVFHSPTQLGQQNGTLTATATAGGTVTGMLRVTGTQALVFTGADTGAFGTVAIGAASTTRNIVFQNVSDASTTLVQTVLTNTTGTDFSIVSDSCGGQSIAPGATCTIGVRFVPSGTAGARAGTVAITAAVGGTTTTASVPLTGTAQ